MVTRELLMKCLDNLSEESDSKHFRETTEVLLKIHRNIYHNEDDTQYRRIKPNNPSFRKKVWNVPYAKQFMFLSGWMEIHNVLIFNSDEKLLDIISVLLEYRHVAPSEEEWIADTKYEGKSEAQEREEKLKMEAAVARRKELEEFMKDKKYREQLAKDIKAEILADKQRRKEVSKQPVVGNKATRRTKIRTLQDMKQNCCNE